MAEQQKTISFLGIWEGKISKWNDNLKAGEVNPTDYVSIHFIMGQSKEDITINYDEYDAMVALQVRKTALTSIVPTDKNVNISKNGTYSRFVLMEFNINAEQISQLAVLAKEAGGQTNYVTAESFTNGDLSNDLLNGFLNQYPNTSADGNARILCSSTRPPCTPW